MQNLNPEELNKYADEFWDKGSFVQSLSSEDLKAKESTFHQTPNENMNFNCKKCSIKISAHNKDWHEEMCDECFNKIYFPIDKEEIKELINELKKYDNEKGYKLEYKNIKKKLEPVIKALIDIGEKALDFLHPLLMHEETWSSSFTLEILKGIKNKKSIPYLINFIVKTEKTDYGDYGEEAMFALTDIGDSAVEPLIREINNQFEKKLFYFYLIGALTEIKNDRVYNFMKEITEDYIKNEDKYGEWFCIDAFVSDFEKQGKKEILPVLKKLLTLERISKHERIEIKEPIEMLEDPLGYEQRSKAEMERFKSIAEKYMQEGGGINKKVDRKEFEKRMWTPEENLEIQFKCLDCNKKQNINPGIIKIMGAKPSEFSFENEILCKFCFSNNMKLTDQGGRDIVFQSIGTYKGNRTGIVSAEDQVYVENKSIPFKKTYDYILKRLIEEPENGELYLRAGNIARNFNKYKEAIKHYEKAIELNPKLIAAYLNLVEIYEFRNKYYKIEDAKVTAVFYLNEMMDTFRTGDFDTATLKNKGDVLQFIGEKSESLDVKFPELVKIPINQFKEKIGRNAPCPCGSEKKYKKCCMEK